WKIRDLYFKCEVLKTTVNKGLRCCALAIFLFALLCPRSELDAQSLSSSRTVRGSVLDPSGAAVNGAIVAVHNPVTGYSRPSSTNSQGNFDISNVPFNTYHLTASA